MWKTSGVPSGRLRKPRPVGELAGVEGIVKAVRRADLTPDDAFRIVSLLKNMGLIEIAAVKNTGAGAVT
ncbi:MAG: hypothetical protein FWH41_09130, partial [Treponema sp.]|nr:hypothetical protein [Treponema sp.]